MTYRSVAVALGLAGIGVSVFIRSRVGPFWNTSFEIGTLYSVPLLAIPLLVTLLAPWARQDGRADLQLFLACGISGGALLVALIAGRYRVASAAVIGLAIWVLALGSSAVLGAVSAQRSNGLRGMVLDALPLACLLSVTACVMGGVIATEQAILPLLSGIVGGLACPICAAAVWIKPRSQWASAIVRAAGAIWLTLVAASLAIAFVTARNLGGLSAWFDAGIGEWGIIAVLATSTILVMIVLQALLSLLGSRLLDSTLAEGSDEHEPLPAMSELGWVERAVEELIGSIARTGRTIAICAFAPWRFGFLLGSGNAPLWVSSAHPIFFVALCSFVFVNYLGSWFWFQKMFNAGVRPWELIGDAFSVGHLTVERFLHESLLLTVYFLIASKLFGLFVGRDRWHRAAVGRAFLYSPPLMLFGFVAIEMASGLVPFYEGGWKRSEILRVSAEFLIAFIATAGAASALLAGVLILLGAGASARPEPGGPLDRQPGFLRRFVAPICAAVLVFAPVFELGRASIVRDATCKLAYWPYTRIKGQERFVAVPLACEATDVPVIFHKNDCSVYGYRQKDVWSGEDRFCEECFGWIDVPDEWVRFDKSEVLTVLLPEAQFDEGSLGLLSSEVLNDEQRFLPAVFIHFQCHGRSSSIMESINLMPRVGGRPNPARVIPMETISRSGSS